MIENLKTNVVARLYYGDFDNPKTGTRCRIKINAESKTSAILKARDMALENGWKLVGVVYKDVPASSGVSS